jgi:protein-L-isoaspartate(D-aspartate) O-methyltransferase
MVAGGVGEGDSYGGYRTRLVETLRRKGVKDLSVLRAIQMVPRHLFVPESVRHRAYDDVALPIGSGQTISQPYVVALMTERLEPRRDHRILEIGTGSGYQTAILAYLARAGKIFTVERLPDLLVEAEERFRRLGLTNIETRLGDGAAGWLEEAPFDRIIVAAAAPRIPEPLTAQLAPGGRMVIPVGDLASQELVILERPANGNGLVERQAGGVRFVPLISRLAFTDEH